MADPVVSVRIELRKDSGGNWVAFFVADDGTERKCLVQAPSVGALLDDFVTAMVPAS